MSGKEELHKKRTKEQCGRHDEEGTENKNRGSSAYDKNKTKESEKIREEMLRRLDENMDAHLEKEKRTRHIDFIKDKITAWGKRHDRELAVCISDTEDGVMIDVKKEDGETVHRFCVPKEKDAEQKQERSEEVTLLPQSVKTRDGAFAIEFDISEALGSAFGIGCGGR